MVLLGMDIQYHSQSEIFVMDNGFGRFANIYNSEGVNRNNGSKDGF